jgi:hypothetical protein
MLAFFPMRCFDRKPERLRRIRSRRRDVATTAAGVKEIKKACGMNQDLATEIAAHLRTLAVGWLGPTTI